MANPRAVSPKAIPSFLVSNTNSDKTNPEKVSSSTTAVTSAIPVLFTSKTNCVWTNNLNITK